MNRPSELPDAVPLDSLRRLARGLVLERGSAEDLVQDAWVAALQSRVEIQGLGGWLAGVVRRLARNRAREERRRGEREESAARAEALPSALEANALIELLQRLLAAVARLESPYREAVSLRYFDDLPPRAIAARLGVPVNTARTHVRRGIERLRAELDPGPGREREALMDALAPFVAGDPWTTGKDLPDSPSWRELVMQNPLALVSSFLVLGTLAWFLVRPREPLPALGNGKLAQAPGPQGSSGAPAPLPALPTRPTAAPGRSPGGEGAGERAPLVSAWTVRGHASHLDGKAFPGAALVGRLFAGGKAEGNALLEEHFTAQSNGAFAWSLTPPAGLFTVQIAGGSATHRGPPVSGWFLADDPAPEDWNVSLRTNDASIHGVVRAPDGTPLAGAWVGFALGDESRAVRSASDGSYTLASRSAYPPRAVIAWSSGFAPGYVWIAKPAPGGQVEGEIVLGPEVVLHGTVRDENGNPLAGAVVAQEEPGFPPMTSEQSGQLSVQSSGTVPSFSGTWPSVTTDANGRYELGGIHAQGMSVGLSASAPGARPGHLSCRPSTIGQQDLDIALQAGVTLTGTVRAAGGPVEAAWVSAGDEPGELTDVHAWCDAEGHFTLEGVPTGSQHLWIWRRGFAQVRLDLDVFEGAPPLEVALVPGHFLGGLVLGADGAPAPWTWVSAIDASGAAMPVFGGCGTYTNDEGRFRITDLPQARVLVVVGDLAPELALDRDDHVLQLATRDEPVAPPSVPAPVPVVPVTAASGEARLEGLLFDSAGNVRAGETLELAAVSAEPAAGPWRVICDAHGAFTFANLPAGTFDVRWVRREGALEVIDQETRLTLAAFEQRTVELQPEGQTTLHGRIEFQDHLPAGSTTKSIGAPMTPGIPPGGMPALAAVQLVRLDEHYNPIPAHRRGTFAHDGVFELEGLAAGAWHIVARLDFGHNKKGNYGSQIEVPETGTTEFVLPVLFLQ